MEFINILRSLWADLRIIKAEHHIHQALRSMPSDSVKSKRLKEATDRYFERSTVIPFPAGSILQERIES